MSSPRLQGRKQEQQQGQQLRGKVNSGNGSMGYAGSLLCLQGSKQQEQQQGQQLRGKMNSGNGSCDNSSNT
jgi:hypothetical protein